MPGQTGAIVHGLARVSYVEVRFLPGGHMRPAGRFTSRTREQLRAPCFNQLVGYILLATLSAGWLKWGILKKLKEISWRAKSGKEPSQG